MVLITCTDHGQINSFNLLQVHAYGQLKGVDLFLVHAYGQVKGENQLIQRKFM